MKKVVPVLILGMLVVGCIPSTTTPAPQPTLIGAPVSTEPPQADSRAWWQDAVFYEIFVRSFYDSDGDGIGDFNGISQKLDYLNDGDPNTHDDLGITAIWLMPIHPSPSYHGYDVINYYGVNHDYGTMDDFKNLLAEAHERGIRVIIDLVVNHTSDQHPFFVDAVRGPDSEYHDWYVWSPVSKGAGWHQAAGAESLYYYGYFCGCMPDLNLTNPAVTDQLNKVANFWLETVGVDGFRVDAAKHLIEDEAAAVNSPGTHEWLRDFHLYYKSLNPDAYAVGEVAGSDARLVSTYTGDQFDQIFNFEMASGVVNSVYGEAVSSVRSAVYFTQNDMPSWNFGTFLTNHDQDRAMSVLGGNVAKAKNAAFILLTSPGTPYIYYGEEIGMMGRKPDENIRKPMQWTGDEHGGFSSASPWMEPDPAYLEDNVQEQLDDPDSLLAMYRKLIALRTSNLALAEGSYIPVESSNKAVYAYIRQKDESTFLVIVNLSKESIYEPSFIADRLVLADDTYQLVDLWSGVEGQELSIQNGGFDHYIPLQKLEPYSGYIFEILK